MIAPRFTLYELYSERIQYAAIEEKFGKGPWAWVHKIMRWYWQIRLNQSTVGDLSKILVATPQRRRKDNG